MKAILAAAGCIGLSMVLAGPTYAQTSAQTAAPGTVPAGTMTATAQDRANAPTGNLEMYNGKWRASKLVGANVYNQLGQSIGSVDDLLIGEDGKVANAVLSVGGFLGIGGKLVSIPFNEFKFVESKNSLANNAAGTAPAGSGLAPNNAAPAAGTTVNNNPAVNRTAAENGTVPARAEPIYYSLVLPDATKDSLNAAAGFKYNANNG
jgi:sporulation protein YlmC with PRC-barrel domain